MAKKEKTPLTFEEIARKKERKEHKGKLFKRTFLKAFALFAAFAICYFAVMIAFVPEVLTSYEPFVVSGSSGSSGSSSSPASTPASSSSTTPSTPASTPGSSSSSSSSSAAADTSSNDAAEVPANETPADNGQAADVDNGDVAPADNGEVPAEVPAEEDALTVFNTAINKVKSEASAITHTRGGSKTVDGVNPVDDASKLPFVIPKSLANSIIQGAMNSNGVKDDGSVIDPAAFPVENQAHSSQLTADDVVSATKNGNTITIVIKDDELGEADNGHCQKAMNVIKAATIMENIPSVASSIASNAQTSAKNGTIIATLDDNGHVVAADYSFNWDIRITGSGIDAIIHLASEEHYTIAY